MSDISAEQRALEDRIITYGKRVSDGSSQNCGRYQLRGKKRMHPMQSEDVTSQSPSRNMNKSSKGQSPKKRPRTVKTTRVPQ